MLWMLLGEVEQFSTPFAIVTASKVSLGLPHSIQTASDVLSMVFATRYWIPFAARVGRAQITQSNTESSSANTSEIMREQGAQSGRADRGRVGAGELIASELNATHSQT